MLGVSPGNYRRHGAFAEKIAVPQHILYAIPENVSFEEAAMVEPVAVAAHAINVSGLKPGNSAVVAGTGMIGFFIVQLLSLFGASPVIAIDIDIQKLKLAQNYGADYSFKADDENLTEKILQLSRNRGADLSFEVVGISDSVRTCIENTRKGGTVVLVGNLSPQIQFPLQQVVTKEITVQEAVPSTENINWLLTFLQKKK